VRDNGRVSLYRDDGIVLRTQKLGEADRIVTVLTRRNGRVRAVGKGVRRTKSRFGARLEPFTHVDLLLYTGRSLDVITQAETVRAYGEPLAVDYPRYTSGTAMLETAERFTPIEKEPLIRQFLLLVGGLRALGEGAHDPRLVLDAYLLRTLAVAGYAPALDECAVCGTPDSVSPEGRPPAPLSRGTTPGAPGPRDRWLGGDTPSARPASPADAPQGLLSPMTVRTTGERIAERFVTAIALGQFVPGQRLPTERELAAMLSVSRATVREAIARLAEAGYVTVRRGRSGGTFVTDGWGPDSDEMIRRTLGGEWHEVELLLDFRQVIEQQIARTAAVRRTGTDVKAIQAALADYERAGADRDSSRMADLALHRAIADATHNPHLTSLSLSIRHDISFGFEAEPYSPEVRGRALHQHPVLAQAVIDGNPGQAAALAAEHFSLTESMLRELHARVMLRAGTPPGTPQE